MSLRRQNLLNERGVQLRSLNENVIDTTTPSGKLIFGVFGLMAEFERDMLRQRTTAGLAAARTRGRVMLASGDYSKTEVAAELGVSRHTLWRELSIVNG